MNQTKNDAIEAIKTLRPFIGRAQLAVIGAAVYGPERQFFIDKLCELADLVATMPETYEQDGKGDQAVAYLHYFRAGMDWYITERDSDPDGNGQLQAFGLADLGYGGELGYICIEELIGAGVELDLHFTPRTLATIQEAA